MARLATAQFSRNRRRVGRPSFVRRPISTKRPDVQAALLKSAKKIFAREGYVGGSVKKIAEDAGANVAMVSYYFGGKEGLYRKCLEEFGKQNLSIAKDTLTTPHSREELSARLRIFADQLLQSYLKDLELTTIIQTEFDLGVPRMEDLFRKTLVQTHQTLVSFLTTAQQKDLISRQIEPSMAATLFFGLIIHWTRRSVSFRKFLGVSLESQSYRASFLEHILHIFFNGIKK